MRFPLKSSLLHTKMYLNPWNHKKHFFLFNREVAWMPVNWIYCKQILWLFILENAQQKCFIYLAFTQKLNNYLKCYHQPVKKLMSVIVSELLGKAFHNNLKATLLQKKAHVKFTGTFCSLDGECLSAKPCGLKENTNIGLFLSVPSALNWPTGVSQQQKEYILKNVSGKLQEIIEKFWVVKRFDVTSLSGTSN